MTTSRREQLVAASPFVTEEVAARYLELAPKTLNHRRCTRINCPPYWKTSDSLKAGVRYRLDELERWVRGEWSGPTLRVMGRPI